MPDTPAVRQTGPVTEPVRTYRLSDELYRAAQEVERRLAFEAGEPRPDLSRRVKLAMQAFAADPAAFEAACRRIIEKGEGA